MEELKTIETVDTSPFKKMVMTIGELPTSFVESMTYYELLAWLCNYLQNTVIPTVNNNAEAVEELQGLFIELKTFVDEYFDNLDVQEEINNKLDAMAEAGTLQDIIYEYLNSIALFCYDTVADLKLAENLVSGSYAKTLGFHSVNDGGGCLYKISDTGTANEKDVIACQNDLLAVLIPDLGNIYPEQFGAYGDGTHDDTTYIQYALDNFDTVKLHNKSYLAKGIKLVSFKTLIGDGENTKLIGDDTTDGLLIYMADNSDIERLNIQNITLTNYIIGINAIGVKYSQFHNVKTDYCNLGARFAGKTFANKLYNCEFRHSTTDGFECGLPVTHPISNTTVNPNIATFDFYSCAFHINGGYGINGWMRVFNFYGGYSENNTSGAVKMVSTSTNFSTENSFFGFDIEEEFIGYRFETSDNSDCNFNYINIIGGQIALKPQTDNELRAVLYFKGNRCRWDSVHNINVQTRHITTTTDNNTYDIYADVTTGLASASIMCDYNSASSTYAVLKTNLYSMKPCNIFKVSEDLPLALVNNYFNINNSKIELPAGESFKITMPNLAYIDKVKVTSAAAASLKLYAYGQNTDIYKQTGSTGTTASDSDNVTTLSVGTDGDSFVIRNMDSSNAVTITNIHLDGYIGR